MTRLDSSPVLWWIRLDLRLADNPALTAAIGRGRPVLPVFVWAPEEEAPWSPGAASRWWLHHSLAALARSLEARGSRLLVRRGPTAAALDALIAETGARAVFWNRRYEPVVVERDRGIKERLRRAGIEAQSANGALLHEPWTVTAADGAPFRVFSPFWRRSLALADPPTPTDAPATLRAPDRWPDSLDLDALALRPTIAWDAGLAATWTPGEDGARSRLDAFVASHREGASDEDASDRAERLAVPVAVDGAHDPFAAYPADRDHPDRSGTSRLSPHLHFGELSARQVFHAALAASGARGLSRERARQGKFVAELGWREFAYHLLYHFPTTPEAPLQSAFETLAWRSDPDALRAWQQGRTGIPIVDAGLRELWSTGWMHNRTRMLAASLLTKNLLLPWQDGAAWFWDTLVDADLASNTLGWQWTAGCGADAASYVRVFNPVTQGRKLDAAGDYVRRFVPELAKLPADWIHEPWAAPPLVLAEAGVVIGRDYPFPIVDLAASRAEALRIFGELGS